MLDCCDIVTEYSHSCRVWRTGGNSDSCKIRLLFCAVVLPIIAFGQVNGSINGTVTDASQAVISGANLVLRNTQTGETRQTSSSEEGFFNFIDVPRGEYAVRVRRTDFANCNWGHCAYRRSTDDGAPKLDVGSVRETVEVQAAPPPVVTSTSSVSQLVDSKRIEQLPLNGRNALQLVALLPGVINAGTGGQFGATQSTFSTSGGRNIDMNFTLDGGYNMNSFYSIANEYPNPDALQEFTTTTRNYSAAFGRGTSSVSAVTRSGGNVFHGSAFEFLRNTELDSRYFFAAKRADFKRNQYGGTLGGPIVKNRLFFFVGYQGTKVSRNTQRHPVPHIERCRTRRRFFRSGDRDSRSRQPGCGFPEQPNSGLPHSAVREQLPE